MGKRALITGITGQDGSYLAELLLEKGYELHGIIRRSSINYTGDTRIKHIQSDINLHFGDLTDAVSLQRVVADSMPHEIYNLGAQSHVGISYQNPLYTAQVAGLGALNLLEAVKAYTPFSKVYQASTSEMFGNNIDSDGFQRETTAFKPANPYAVSKVFAHQIGVNYRNAYNMFVSNGILFNHESPRRGDNFVTAKVIKGAVRIKKGLQEKLGLGTLDTYRDWGHAKDYVRAMYLMLQQNVPNDYICATGTTRSIRELCKYVFSSLDLDYKDYVYIDPKFVRPEETVRLKGDPTKLMTEIGWKPEYTFESMIDEILDFYTTNINY